ncbi:lipoyl(octanoyl) transferase LipB [Chloroflexota bacterium]
MKVKKLCHIYDIGLVDYAETSQLQEELMQLRIEGRIADVVLLLQHPPVLTIGASGGEENIIASRNMLDLQDMPIMQTDRGGNITHHGPGQLVGYLVFDLKDRGRDLHQYMRNLEEVVIRTLRDFGIEGSRDHEYPGVWVGQEKICAVGVRVRRWVTKHGFALNVNNNLKAFSYINPCGIIGRQVTSMQRLLGYNLKSEEVISRVSQHLLQIFDIHIEQRALECLNGYNLR